MRYLYSPSTLSAPDALWPARTDARAVFEVLLATAVLLEEKQKKGRSNSTRFGPPRAVEAARAVEQGVPLRPLRGRCCRFFGAPSVPTGIMGHDNRGRGRRGRRTSVIGRSPCQRVASYTSTRPHS